MREEFVPFTDHASRFLIRSFRRFPVHCPVYYASETVQGTGTLWNISLKGSRIDGTEAVEPGTVLKLSVILPGHFPTVLVERATVRWSRGQEFGLELISMRDDEQARLTSFVTTLV
jgi:hypothetical protein